MGVIAHLSRRRLWLNVFLASIAVNAVLGIWALLVDDFGEIQGKILTSSFLVSATMVGLLANAVPMRERVLWPLPVIASATSTTGFALLIVAVWVEPDSDAWGRTLLSTLTIAGGATLAGLLGLLRLQEWQEVVRQATVIAIGVLCVTIVAVLWAEPDSDWWLRVIGIESVIVAALTLALPAIARFLPPSPPETSFVQFCPACAAPLGPPVPRAPRRCQGCGFEFSVTVIAPPGGEQTVAYSPPGDSK